jgi:predicted nucleic acid-binding protein
MKILCDTNLVIKHLDPGASFHAEARNAVDALHAACHQLVVVPQVYYEFWVVATRPVVNRGLGLTVPAARMFVVQIRATFMTMPEPPTLLDIWLGLVEAHDCKGKVAHDARLAAAMGGLAVTHLLTFNGRDFARFPHVVVLDPMNLSTSP